jgi:thiol:disulfide interchange protein DsbC
MDLAKAGKEIPQLDCENPVEDHYDLGQTVGVTGTPALLLEGGEMVPGYVPAHKLRKALDARREQTGG